MERVHPQRTAQTWGRSHYLSTECDRCVIGPAWCRGSEDAVNGDKEDGHDEDWQQGAAVQTISEPGQGDGGVPARTGEPYEDCSWGEVRIWSECSVQDDKWLTRLLKTAGAGLSGTLRNGLSRGHTSAWSGRLVDGCWQT